MLPQIVITKPKTDLCWQCKKNNDRVQKSANMPDEIKSDSAKQQLDHLALVAKERAVYQQMTADCKETCERLQLRLGKNKPSTRRIKMHYSFDFAQQVRIFLFPIT